MLCPICGSNEVKKTETGNGGDIYVTEEMSSHTEPFDFNISMFKCVNGHTFYTDENQ